MKGKRVLHTAASMKKVQPHAEQMTGQDFDFASFDENKDGILSREEFAKAQNAQAESMKRTMTHQEFAEVANGNSPSSLLDVGEQIVEPIKAHPRRKTNDDDWDDLD